MHSLKRQSLAPIALQDEQIGHLFGHAAVRKREGFGDDEARQRTIFPDPIGALGGVIDVIGDLLRRGIEQTVRTDIFIRPIGALVVVQLDRRNSASAPPDAILSSGCDGALMPALLPDDGRYAKLEFALES